MTNILKLLNTKERILIGILIAFIVVQVWLDLKAPEYMGEMTRIINSEGALGNMDDIITNGMLMLYCTLGSLVTAIIVGFIAARVGSSFAQRLRSEQFNKVDSFSMREINKFSIASLVTRSTNDVTQVQWGFVLGLQIVTKGPILIVWAVLKMSGKAIEWSMAAGIAMACIAVLFVVILVLVVPKFKKMQVYIDDVNKATRENLLGLPVVRAYNAEDHQEAKFEVANEDLTYTQLYTSRAMAALFPVIFVIIQVMILSIYWIAAILVNQAGSPMEAVGITGDMMVFIAYAMQVMVAVMMIMMLFIMLPRALVSAKRISEVINTEPSIKDGTVTETEHVRKGELEFRNVSFKYPDAADYAIKDISFSVKQGETVAFIGSTGSGKTTLVNLIPRFYDVTEGSVLVNGVDVREYKLEALYNKIGYVPQKSVLFSGTISSNVAYGENGQGQATEDDVKNAVRIAQGKEFVEEKEGAYEGEVARGGTNLSGGQKQRISIARAVCRKPDIYIFDDSFSALDYKTDRSLRTALKKETQGVTSVIVAQRIGTIMDADKIVVLDDNGLVAGIGKHKDLLSSCKVYREIAMSQLSEKELAI